MDVSVQILRDAIPAVRTAVSAERITIGYSTADKFRVTYANGRTAILRIAPESWQPKHEEVCRVLGELRRVGAHVPDPLDVGLLGDRSYCLLSYLAGDSAEHALPGYPPEVAYSIGVQAGADLRTMHGLLPPRALPPWGERRLAKHRASLSEYWTCGVRIDRDEDVAAFIEANADALKDRPSCFQHGDFHVGNVVVREENYVGAIDRNVSSLLRQFSGRV